MIPIEFFEFKAQVNCNKYERKGEDLKSFQHAGLQEKLNDTLRNKEKVLWLFENAHGTILHKLFIAYGFAFSMAWCVVVFWMIRPALGEYSMLPFLILFPAIGIFQTVFLGWALLRRNKFAYVVTSQRVILMNSVGAGYIRSIGPDQLTSLSRSGTDKKGTISFSSGTSGWDWTGGMASIFLPTKIANIPNVKQVEELIYEHLAGPEVRRIKAQYPNRKPNHFHGY